MSRFLARRKNLFDPGRDGRKTKSLEICQNNTHIWVGGIPHPLTVK